VKQKNYLMAKQNKIKIFVSASIVFFIYFFFIFPHSYVVKADSCSDDCKIAYPTDTDAENSCEKKCQDLEKQKKNILNLLKVNDKTQEALSGQIDYINQQQSKNQQYLTNVQDTLEELTAKIQSLERDIAEKEKTIAYQKKILTGLMQSYYDYDQQGVLEFVLWNRELSVSMSQTDYLEQSGMKVSDLLEDIKNTQNELIKMHEQLKTDYEKSADAKDKLQYEKNNLESSENQKQWLLEKTQGDEQKYQDMLAHIEEQKKELFDFSSASNLAEIFDSVKNYPKPDKKNQASTSWYFSQTDSRWGSQRIGNSKSLMKDWGCAVASVAMVFRKYGSSTDPGKLAKEKIFYADLINWPLTWNPNIERVSSVSHGNLNWTTINSQISSGHLVIVYIKRTSGGGGHYVVITGKDSKDYIVHDPYFGPNLYLGTSMSLIGKLGADSKTKIDQMIIYN
jgi:peptidoglycan hydrolase CwlO-like protein